MKNLNSLTRSLFIGLTLFALFSTANAQGVDLKELKAQKEAESIKKFTDSKVLFYNLVPGVRGQTNKNLGSIRERGDKIRNDTPGYITTLENFIAILKTANRFNEQFDKDVATLLGSNKVSGRLTRVSRARKLLASVINSTAVNSLRKDVAAAVETLEFSKNEDVCKFLAVGIVVEAMLLKKSTTGNDKFYDQYGCK